jgi:hypothetical protein
MWVHTNAKTNELVNLAGFRILRVEAESVVARGTDGHVVLFHGEPARCQVVFHALLDGLASGIPFYDAARES